MNEISVRKMVKHPIKRMLQNREWVIVVVLSLLVILLRWPSLEQPFDNDSGANAYHARLIVRGEPLYGTHHPAHHMPAVYYAYALAFLLLGDSLWAVKFLLILWTIATVYLLYRLGTLLVDRAMGLLAAVFCAMLSAHILMAGTSAEIELFANLPRIAAILVLIHLTTRDATAWRFAFVGVLSAAAFLFKAVYLSPLAMAGFVLLVELWQNRSTIGAWQATMMRGFWVGVGFAAGLLTVVAYFGVLGLLPRFLLVFTLGQEYVGLRSISEGSQYSLLYPLAGLAVNNSALLTFSLAALLIIAMNQLQRHRSQRNEQWSMVSYVAVWYILSFIEAGINRASFTHYCLLIVPPLALLAAWLSLKIYHDVQVRVTNRFVAPLLLLVLLATPLFISIEQNFPYYYHYVRYKLRLEAYQDFLLNGWPAEGEKLVPVQELADYLQRHTSTTDYIYYWSELVQLYYQADRRCPIDMIWPLYAEATGSYQRIFVPQTKYIIVSESNSMPHPDWLYTELAEKYTLEKAIRDQQVFLRTDRDR